MRSERPPITQEDIEETLEDPDHDDGRTAWKRLGRRTVIVRYRHEEERIKIDSVSATRRKLDP